MVVARKLLRTIEKTFYEKYNTVFSPYIVVIFYDPLKIDPKTDPKVESILNILNKGINFLKTRAQKKILSLIMDKEIEIPQS